MYSIADIQQLQAAKQKFKNSFKIIFSKIRVADVRSSDYDLLVGQILYFVPNMDGLLTSFICIIIMLEFVVLSFMHTVNLMSLLDSD